MDLSEIMRKVTALAECKGYVTFDELDQIIPPTLPSEDIESLLSALTHAGISVQEQ